MNLSEKISKVLEAKSLTTHAAERMMSASMGTLAKAISRNAGWHSATEQKFLRTFNVNITWWETGTGEMFDRSNGNEKEERALQTAYFLIDKLTEEVSTLKEELAKYKNGKSKA